jgi:hypothetical protein
MYIEELESVVAPSADSLAWTVLAGVAVGLLLCSS